MCSVGGRGGGKEGGIGAVVVRLFSFVPPGHAMDSIKHKSSGRLFVVFCSHAPYGVCGITLQADRGGDCSLLHTGILTTSG